jgi:dihydroneopterin aldolase
MNTKLIPWTIEVRALATELRRDADPRCRQAACVDITIRALAPAFPQTIEDCINYQPICEHVLGRWSAAANALLPETAVRELMAFILGFDERIGQVDVALSTGGVTLRRTRARRRPAQPTAGWRQADACLAA